MLLANKTDLDSPRQVSNEDLRQWCAEQYKNRGLKVEYRLVSAKSGEGVNDAFVEIGNIII